MIPFARIIKYGNIPPAKLGVLDIKVSSGGTIYLLDGDKKLHTIGTNLYGELGIGSVGKVVNTSWNHVLSGVEKIYAGNSGAFAINNIGAVYYVGDASAIGLTGTFSTFFNITSSVFGSLSTLNVKEIISSGSNTVVLMNDGKLYGCGRNNSYQLGLGDSAVRTSLTLITEFVDSVKLDSECLIISKTDGSQYFCGQYNYGVDGTSVTTNGYRTTPLFKFSSPVGATMFTGSTTYIWSYYNKNTNTTYSRGWNIFGALGSGNSTNSSTFITKAWNTDTVSNLINSNTNKATYTQLLLTSSGIWGVGYNVTGILGDGSTTGRNTWVKATNLPFEISDIKMCAYGSPVGVVYTHSGDLYFIGDRSTLYDTNGSSVYVTTYTKTYLPE